MIYWKQNHNKFTDFRESILKSGLSSVAKNVSCSVEPLLPRPSCKNNCSALITAIGAIKSETP